MTTAANPPHATRSAIGALILTGVIATAAASVATVAVAAAGHAAGISLGVGDDTIPLSGFGLLTAAFSLVGVLLAVLLARFARRPRRTFVLVTVVLTALSLVPDLLIDAGAATKALLILTHLVAAAIVVPALARRLAA
ncbi:hypothetical protein GA0070216_10536 [Micromonospora matsumotoense]|uniref:PEP-CTERM protein-sorting domain-containing protein n=1 Tax=Micromonospora matsumotoense TaxID=121616 RepID=A0A1C4XMF7_9ACTN|nr:DUF6069 family protein [Micromonospora matsumotoense]SCF09657.1 hypothetical protein GA0070216_10536 [Micromonospora matsumotoense]